MFFFVLERERELDNYKVEFSQHEYEAKANERINICDPVELARRVYIYMRARDERVNWYKSPLHIISIVS